MLNYRGHTIGDSVCHCGQVHDARRLRTDPTGTAGIRRAFAADVDIRWRGVRRMIRTVLVAQDLLGRNGGGVGADTAMRVQSFESWLDSMVRTTVVDAGMVRGYVDRASALGVRTAAALVGSGGQTRGRVDLITGLAVSELRTVGSQVTQQATRVVSDGLLKNKTTARILLDVLQVIDKVGIPRSRLTTDHVVVRAYNDATLDVFEQAGHGMVDVMPELRPATRVGDAKKTKKSRKTGPGSRVSRARTPSARTIGRIAKLEAETEAWAKRVNVETAEDDKVCTICLDIAEEGPYSINTARSLIPAHPRCRCAFVPVRRRVKDFNPYHEPKGSSKGGRFASPNGKYSIATAKLAPNYQDPNTGEGRNSAEFQKFVSETVPTPWTKEEQQAISDYTFQDFIPINSTLRQGRGKVSDDVKDKVALLDSALGKATLQREVLSFRTVSPELAAKIDRAADGELFVDHGFTSVSTSRQSVSNFNDNNSTPDNPIYAVVLPRGTHAAPVSHVGQSPDDNEILVARGGIYSVRKSVGGRVIRYERPLR